MIEDLIKKNRSYRRFHGDVKVEEETLRELVSLARYSASASNLQPLKYILSSDDAMNAMIFPHLSWAAHIQGWDGPEEDERPAAYIFILGDTEIATNFWCDHGIAAQSILLGATERGLGGCILGAIDRDKLRDALEIPAQYEIFLIIALGKPREKVVIETLEPGGDTKYWRDDDSIHHVPKRTLDEIIIG